MKKIKIIGLFLLLIILSIGYQTMESFSALPRNWMKGNSA